MFHRFSVSRKSQDVKDELVGKQKKKLFYRKPIPFLMLVSLFLWSAPIAIDANDNKLPTLSSSDNPVYYVIQCADNGLYMEYEGKDRLGVVQRTKCVSGVSNSSLWYFEPAGSNTSATEGVKIVSKGAAEDTKANGKYLSDNLYLGDLARYEQSGATFYIAPNTYDQIGCMVSTTSDFSGNCWHSHLSSNYIELSNISNDETYKWIFKSYDDLLEDAEANGVDISSYSGLDQSNATNFQNLINAINSAKAVKQVQSPTSGKSYILRNRRYGYYLNSNGTSFYGAATPTAYSTWLFQNIGGTPVLVNATTDVSVRMNTSASNHLFYSLDPSVSQAYNATIIASSDGDRRFVAFQGTTVREGVSNKTFYMAMVSSLTIEGREGQSYSSDWEFIEAEAGTNYDISIESEQALIPEGEDPLKAQFFRLRNVSRDVMNYSEDKQFDGGGWLEDVDHTHAQYRLSETSSSAYGWVQEEAELMYSAKDADIYCALPNMTHASALWEFIRVGRGSGELENATGVLSPEHDIFIIRNANSGKYIYGLASQNGSFYDVTMTENKADAVKVYLQKLIDGQYGLMVYGGTNFSGENAGKDVNIGALRVTETNEGYHAGLTWEPNVGATVNSNSAWIIMPAPTLELDILTTGTDDGYEWSTIYYPFDIKLAETTSGREVKFFQGGWSREPDYTVDPSKVGIVEMKEVVDVPGGNAVIVRSSLNGEESYGRVVLNVYPAGGMESSNAEGIFEGNVWKGVSESEGHYFGDDWRNYWILSKNRNGELKLLHPAGNYLLPNRAYIDNESAASLGNNVKLSSITLVFPENTSDPTGISTVGAEIPGNSKIYNINGQLMNAESIDSLPAGIYIKNGKKFIVR